MQTANTTELTPFDASDWRLGIVVAQFNQQVTGKLHQGVLDRAGEYKIGSENIDSVAVAGSIEIPLVLQQMAASKRYDALVAIGCVIKGETAHFDYVCRFVTDGILRVQLDHQIPVGFGVLTCLNEQQALDRVHLGGEYLDAVLHQARAIAGLNP